MIMFLVEVRCLVSIGGKRQLRILLHGCFSSFSPKKKLGEIQFKLETWDIEFSHPM